MVLALFPEFLEKALGHWTLSSRFRSQFRLLPDCLSLDRKAEIRDPVRLFPALLLGPSIVSQWF